MNILIFEWCLNYTDIEMECFYLVEIQFISEFFL